MAFDDILALTLISIMATLSAISVSLWHAWKYECRIGNMRGDDNQNGGGQ